MKKILAIILALAMVLGLAACGKKDPAPVEPVGPGGENPVTAMESVEAINNELGLKLSQPGVMGVTDNYYSIVDCGDFKIGEYGFDVNGYECVFRGSPVYDQDISGIYLANGTAYEGKDVSDALDYVFSGDYKLARWATIDGQYVFLLIDSKGEMEEDTFKGIAEELKSLTNPGQSSEELAAYYYSFAGSYGDSYSQRAVADVTASENGLHILVHWGSSAMESTNWEMNAILTEDGLLSYSDETRTDIVFKEDGTEEYTVKYEGEAGFFAPSEGKLEWTGAFEEDCRQCVFEQYIAN